MNNINVLEFLENSASLYPNKVIFADEKTSITYSEFVKKAKSFGSLIASKTKPQSPVAVLGDKSVDAVLSFFSIIYAGCFYVPLNIRHPKERLNSIYTLVAKNSNW